MMESIVKNQIAQKGLGVKGRWPYKIYIKEGGEQWRESGQSQRDDKGDLLTEEVFKNSCKRNINQGLKQPDAKMEMFLGGGTREMGISSNRYKVCFISMPRLVVVQGLLCPCQLPIRHPQGLLPDLLGSSPALTCSQQVTSASLFTEKTKPAYQEPGGSLLPSLPPAPSGLWEAH